MWNYRIGRRRFLHGASVLAALALPRAGTAATRGKPARSIIVLWMDGGPSHLETFDPKPGTPEGGPTTAIATALPGLKLARNLPKLAKQAKRLAVVRGMTSPEGDHERAVTFVRTGRPPMPATPPPGIGAVLSRERSGAGPALRAVSLLAPGAGAGFLGAEHAPLLAVDPENPLEGWFAEGHQPAALARRTAALEALERAVAEGGTSPSKVEAEQRRVSALARDFLGSPLIAAMEIGKEPARVRDAYGRTPFGNGCLLARRLVEAGVPFVEVSLDGWDSHQDNFAAHEKLCGAMDPAFAALLDDLAQRGLLESTLVLWAGEFGRTPVINAQRGRDHHPHAFSVALAGGPVRAGQVIGRTDARGNEVAERPVTVPDLLATVYTAMGVAPDKAYVTPDGRPVTLLEKAAPVAELL
jgi:uncharacterized protein (DUF1501 family)